ncbi:hypothetical protein DL765_010921 [Monosporascus sp. GIB2]|nr:hypothetical protein DL765_010921 [Monosporascus sp. GIB2]
MNNSEFSTQVDIAPGTVPMGSKLTIDTDQNSILALDPQLLMPRLFDTECPSDELQVGDRLFKDTLSVTPANEDMTTDPASTSVVPEDGDIITSIDPIDPHLRMGISICPAAECPAGGLDWDQLFNDAVGIIPEGSKMLIDTDLPFLPLGIDTSIYWNAGSSAAGLSSEDNLFQANLPVADLRAGAQRLRRGGSGAKGSVTEPPPGFRMEPGSAVRNRARTATAVTALWEDRR